jgi:hypothetical protein
MTTQTNPPRRRAAASFLVTFGFAWLMIGLFTGTIVLVLFVRGIVSTVHGLGFGQSAENGVLICVILLFVVASFMLTRSVVRRLYRTPSVRARRLALGALVVPGIASMWAWSNPTAMLANFAGSESSSVKMEGGPEFVFGAYPQPERLEQLQKEGYTAVISLQHPTVVVEVQGIAMEKAATKRLGLPLIQTPMLPWVSDNEASLNKIREIVKTGKGKYYVHCGLGRDRVNVVRRVVESMAKDNNVRLARATDLMNAKGLEQRTTPMQYGRLFQLRPGVWLLPIPNTMELSDILFGAPGRVLLVLDPTDSTQQAWSAYAQQQMRNYIIDFAVVPFTETDAADPQRVAMLASRIRGEKGRVAVIVPRTPFGDGTTERNTKTAQAVMRSFGVSWAVPTDQRSSSQSAGNSGR